jgi:hypothetical protein
MEINQDIPAVFENNKPIADQTGPEVAESVRQSLAALRDAVVAGIVPHWNFWNSGNNYGGTYEQPLYWVWKHIYTNCWIQATFSWGINGHPTSIVWLYRHHDSSTWLELGTENFGWTSPSENLEFINWDLGNTEFDDVFDRTKPADTDYALDCIDDMRNNMMSLRDEAAGWLMRGWSYSVTIGTGSAEQPQYVSYTNGSEVLRATINWHSSGYAEGSVDTILWEFDDGGGFDTVGTITIGYTDDISHTTGAGYDEQDWGWVNSTSWSASSGYTRFMNRYPDGEEASGDTFVDAVRDSQNALIHGIIMGEMPGFNHLIQQGPLYPQLPEGNVWIVSNAGEPWVSDGYVGPEVVVLATYYGTSGFAEYCPAQQVVRYTDTGTNSPTNIATVNYIYGEDGIVETASWDGSAPITIQDFAPGDPGGGPGPGANWDDSLTWNDADTWAD